jgi:hypothetical protein
MVCTDLLAICDTDGPTENWKAIFDLNILALSVCTKEAIQCMLDRKVDNGHIIHINRYVTDSWHDTGRASSI